jgi:MFS family permease
MKRATPTGMIAFLFIWGGQLVSMLGTNMTHFALGIWAWERTGEATALVLVGVFGLVPSMAATFVAGPLIDRWNRQRVMMLADVGAGLATVGLFVLYASGSLQVWHLYVASAVSGMTGAFQNLAYSAAITTLIPKTQYARANSMISLAHYASIIGAPLLAGMLIAPIGIAGIMLLDILTFVVAVGALLVVYIPQPEASPSGNGEVQQFWQDALFGFRYIWARPSLRGVMFIVFAFTMAESLGYPLIMPMILARTGGDELALGSVRSMLGVGGVVGGLLMSVWGGPKRKIHAILIGLVLTGLLGDMLMGLGQTLPMWLVAAVGLEIFIPATVGAYQAIWQSKVAPELQGRVFAARGLMSSVAEPISMVLAGLLSDRWLEPAMHPGGALANVFGDLVGVGPGAGMALILVFCGVTSALAGLAGYVLPSVRHIEAILPDYDAADE